MLIWSANSWILNSYAWPTKNNIHLPTHMTEEYGSDEYFMRQALAQAQMASERGEIPVGVVITGGGRIIARGHKMTETLNDVTAHAEMQAITSAAQSIGGKYLAGCTLYVTLEPCQMCAGAIVQARIPEVMIGCMNPKAGCAGSVLDMLHEDGFNHQAEVETGVLGEECSRMMKDFFKELREEGKRKKAEKTEEIKEDSHAGN